jgi:hypothetical protein
MLARRGIWDLEVFLEDLGVLGGMRGQLSGHAGNVP